MDRLRALEIFKAVVDNGSFIRGAESLNLSSAAITRAVQDLEQLLGVRLLQRTTRRIALTTIGEDVFERAQGLLASFDELAAVSSLSAREAMGALRILAPTAYGVRKLGPALATFAASNPKVRLDLRTTDDDIDLVEDKVDLAVFMGTRPALSQIARRIGVEAVGLFAAPEYLARRGVPLHPMDLRGHDGLSYAGSGDRGAWRFSQADAGAVECQPPRPVMSSNNAETLVAAATHGTGLVRLPSLLVQREVAVGSLVTVLEGWQIDPLEVQLVYSSRRYQPLAVRMLIDHLVAALQPTAACLGH
jgi:LysR family transcriptional regulator for bpeEF and oprC